MTVYCYRCGQPVLTDPQVKEIHIQNSESLLVSYTTELVPHVCYKQEPQDKDA